MFKKEIHVEKRNDIRYGTTKIGYNKTMNEIMGLLDKHGCEETIVHRKEGNLKIGFVYQDEPYMITVPKVYVKGTLNKKIGVRIVKYFLEIILDWKKERLVNFKVAMLPYRVVRLDGKSYQLGEVADEFPGGDMLQSLTSNVEQLKAPEDKQDDVRDVDYRIVDDKDG